MLWKDRTSILLLNSRNILDSIIVDILRERVKYCFSGEKSQCDYILNIENSLYEALRLERIDVLLFTNLLKLRICSFCVICWKNQIVKHCPGTKIFALVNGNG